MLVGQLESAPVPHEHVGELMSESRLPGARHSSRRTEGRIAGLHVRG